MNGSPCFSLRTPNFTLRTRFIPAPCRSYMPQDPPSYPIKTVSPSTMTGTFLTPFENFSISSSLAASALTSKYTALSPKTDLAFSV